MAKLNIGFDIDGVALQYTERYAEVFKLFGGATDLSNPKEFNFLNSIEDWEQKSMYLAFGYMMQENLNAHEDIKTLFKYLVFQKGQTIKFITARQKNLSYESAYRSIRKIITGIGVDDIWADGKININCVGKDGIHGSKVPLIKEMGMDFFVEDRRKNVLEISQAGITVFMPRRSWNTLPENTPNVIQYDDASEIVECLRKL